MLWKEVLIEKYGSNVCGLLEGGIASCPSNSSRWWKDLVSIEGRDGSYWFNKEVARKVRNGAHTKFWDAKWRGGVPFRVKYSRPFAMSNQKEATVADIGVFTGSVMDWRFVWRRRFFIWEEQLLTDLKGHVWSTGADVWVWKMEEDGIFTVKSLYAKLEDRWIIENNWSVEEKRVFTQLWKSPAPSKVVALSWRVS